MSAELGPGSGAPSGPQEVERLLRKVPEVAFHPALHELIPDRATASGLVPAELMATADSEYRERLLAALRGIETAATAEAAGGLAFLARTFAHFLSAAPVPSQQHPLIVALFLRGEARAGRVLDTPLEIGRALDRFEALAEATGQP